MLTSLRKLSRQGRLHRALSAALGFLWSIIPKLYFVFLSLGTHSPISLLCFLSWVEWNILFFCLALTSHTVISLCVCLSPPHPGSLGWPWSLSSPVPEGWDYRHTVPGFVVFNLKMCSCLFLSLFSCMCGKDTSQSSYVLGGGRYELVVEAYSFYLISAFGLTKSCTIVQ